MIEDDAAFRLTPLDVRRYEFGTALRGYDKQRVDEFRELLAGELERLARANQELEQKARNFHEQLRAFRERDKAINDALVSAQQLRSEIREQAEREAQLLLREAQAEADRLLASLQADQRRLQDELAALDRMRRAQLAQLRALVERQLNEIVAAEHAMSLALERDETGAVELEPGRTDPRPSYPTPAWLRKVDDAT
ncbi:MAG TPA: DivIVA domain-containing protein [Gemmatimonadaceae bacterium]|nr:DivIVA domain-containing protein [Gemmatimonadaceae bacterium]